MTANEDTQEEFEGRAFYLPDFMRADETLATLHTEIVERLREEAAGMPMSTVQTLLLERIAFMYVSIRFKEAHPGTPQGFTTPTQQKEYNAFWLSATQEFNKQTAVTNDKYREQLLLGVKKLLDDVLQVISSDKERASARQTITEGLTRLGL